MLSILWQQSSSTRLLLLCRGISSGWCWTSGRFAPAPNLLYWKRHWTVNPRSAFPDCSGFYKHPALLCQSRLGVLICSAIPVSLCTRGFELPSYSAPLFSSSALCFSRRGPRSAPSTHHAWVLYWPGAVWRFGLYYFPNYSTCFSDLCWTLGWHFQTFLCDNLESFLYVVTVNSQTNTCTWNQICVFSLQRFADIYIDFNDILLSSHSEL